MTSRREASEDLWNDPAAFETREWQVAPWPKLLDHGRHPPSISKLQEQDGRLLEVNGHKVQKYSPGIMNHCL